MLEKSKKKKALIAIVEWNNKRLSYIVKYSIANSLI